MHFKKGISALTSMIALGAIIVVVTGTSIWVENNRTASYVSDSNSAQVTAAAESALQDALLKLNLKTTNDNYNIVINNITVGICYYPDQPTAGAYTIRTTATVGGVTRSFKAIANKDSTTSNFKIISKEEEIDSVCTVTGAAAPSAPLNLVWLSSASGQVTISWSVPLSDGLSSITNYKVYRGVTAGGETFLTTLGNTLSYLDTGLTDNANYYYKVSAVNAIGEGALSNEVLAIPGQTPTAGTVTVSNYASGNYVGATYQISTNFTSNNTGLSCDYSTNGGTTWTSATLSGTLPNYNCLKTGVTAQDATSYGINMRMTTNVGVSSATAITKVGDAVGPAVSDNWTNNWTATSPVTVTLTPTDTGSGVSTTKYCVDTTNSCTTSTGTTGTSVSVTCAAGSVYTQYARYAAWDNVNNASAVYSKQVRQDKLAPTDGTLTATPGDSQNSLSWSGFSDSDSGLATSNTYKVVFLTTGTPAASCTTGTNIPACTGTATSCTHTGLTGGTTYYYRVCAYDVVGNVSNGTTGSGVPTQANGTVCTSSGQCASGNCYVDSDGDRYAPASGTKTCRANTQIAGVDCDDSCATCWPGNATCYFTADGKDNDCDSSIDETTSIPQCGTTLLSCTMCNNSVSCGGTGAMCGSDAEGCGPCASDCGNNYICSGTTCKQEYYNLTSATCYH